MSILARRIVAASAAGRGLSPLAGRGNWLLNLIGWGDTAAGVNVTPDTAVRQTAVWRAVVLLSWILAYLPLKTYRVRSDGRGADLAKDHPNYRRLARRPNDWMTSYQWRLMKGFSLFLRGNAYDLLTFNPDMSLAAIVPLHPDSVSVWVAEDGSPVYEVSDQRSGTISYVSRYNIHHTFLWTTDGYTGLNPIEQHRETIGTALATEEYAGRAMANGGLLSGVLHLPPNLSPEAETAMKTSWKDAHTGRSNAGKVAVLKEGAKYEKIAMSLLDAQYIEQRKFSVEDIARIYGVPPELLQHTSPVTSWGTGVEQRFIAFLATTIAPILVAEEQALERDMFLPEEEDVVYPKFNRGALLQTDLLTRYRAYAMGRQWGFLTRNNILQNEEMNTTGPEGDTYLDPMNMIRVPRDPDLYSDEPDQPNAGLEREVADLVRQYLASGRVQGARHA